MLVALFHVYAAWPAWTPYGASYAKIPPVRYGWLGVELFFMISGYVIHMTLEKCASFSDFMRRRWYRLFPAMFIISGLVYATAPLLPPRPEGTPQLIDLLPGLLFIEPLWFKPVLGFQPGVVDHVFWSLFVEVKFYVLFGGVYFAAGRGAAKLALAAGLLASFLMATLYHFAPGPHIAAIRFVLDDGLSCQYYGWFLAGVLAFEAFEPRAQRRVLRHALIAATVLLNCFYISRGRSDASLLFGLALSLLFFASSRPPMAGVVGSRPLVYLGFISYPFYLLHQNFILSITKALGDAALPLPAALVPLAPSLAAVAISHVVAAYLEGPLRACCKGLLAPITRALRT